jgi:cation diffusion facilitator family transporter
MTSIFKRIDFLSPFTVMNTVIGMYVLKVAAKLGLGLWIGSPVLVADGVHNLSDIVEAFMVKITIKISQKSNSDEYPLGQKNIEFILTFCIGLVLILFVSIPLLFKSLLGIGDMFMDLSWLPIEIVQSKVSENSAFAWMAMGVAGTSSVLSLIVGIYQRYAGRVRKHPGLVADGKETHSDGMIEFVVVLGFLAEWLLHAPLAEYILGLVVAGIIINTGKELMTYGYRVLVQHSIDPDHLEAIGWIVVEQPGCRGVDELIAVKYGTGAKVSIVIRSVIKGRMQAHLAREIKRRVKRHLDKVDLEGSYIEISFRQPPTDYHRRAEAVVIRDGQTYIASSLMKATHLRIYEMDHSGAYRTKNHPLDGMELHQRIAVIVDRVEVKDLYIFCGNELEQKQVERAGFHYLKALTVHPMI